MQLKLLYTVPVSTPFYAVILTLLYHEVEDLRQQCVLWQDFDVTSFLN